MKHYIGNITSPFNQDESFDNTRLTISEKSIELEFTTNTHEHRNVVVIYGVFNGFGKVSLFNCKNIGGSHGAASSVVRYSAEYLFRGEFINELASTQFNRVNVEMVGLLNWTNLSSIKNNLFTKKKLEIEEFDAKRIYSSDDFSIELFSSVNTNIKREYNQTTVKENVGLRIKSNEKNIEIIEFLSIIQELKKLLFLLSNNETSIDNTTFYNENDEPTVLIWEGLNSLGSPLPISTSLKFNEIENDLDKIISIWFNNTEIHTSIDLILEKSRNNKLSRENYFLSTCFALETLHRRFKNYKLFQKSKFKEVKQAILNAIDDNAIKELIENSLAHINEPNFRNRLYDFKLDFEKVLPEEKSVEDYIGQIVKTRNYLVHRSSDKQVFDEFEMLYSAIYIEAIVKSNIYEILGISEQVIENVLIKTGRCIHGFYNANKRN